MSLLTIVQQAFGEIGLPPPATVVGNTEVNATQALYLTNRAGLMLKKDPRAPDYWPPLRKQLLFNLNGVGPFTGTFTYNSPTITSISGTGLSSVQPGWIVSSTFVLNDTQVVSVNVAGSSVTMSQNSTVSASAGTGTDSLLAFGQEAYPLPSDYDWFIPQTGWDRNFRWQLLGPVNAQEWQVLKSGISPVGPRLRYRLMNNQIYVNPAPYVPSNTTTPINDLIVLEYPSKLWVATTGAPTVGAQTAFLLDTDVSLLDEDLLTLSLKWRMLKAKGQAYADEFTEYDDEVAKFAGRQTMPRSLPLNARASGIRLLNSQNVPDTGFGS